MKIYILILIALAGIHYKHLASGLAPAKGLIAVKEGQGPGGIWKTNVVWKSYWVKEWQIRKVYVPVWKKVWGPVEVRQFVPVAKPPPPRGWKPH